MKSIQNESIWFKMDPSCAGLFYIMFIISHKQTLKLNEQSEELGAAAVGDLAFIWS